MMMTATKIGKQLGMSAKRVNLLLLEKNVVKRNGKRYVLTEAGKQYGESYSWLSGGLKTISNIKYHETLIDLLQSDVVLTPDKEISYESIDNYDDLPF